MGRPFQFSLRTLLLATLAVGPSVAVGRWLLNLSWFGVLFMAVVGTLLAVILGSQAVLLKAVARLLDD